MNGVKNARKFIEAEPDHPDAAILSALVLALESEASFPLGELYKLSFDRFDLAIEVMRQWRLDRYYTGKARLLDVSMQLHEAAGEAPDPGH